MNTKWERFSPCIQELSVTPWVEVNVYDPVLYKHDLDNFKDWGWDIIMGGEPVSKGRAKTEVLAKRVSELELIKLFREFGKALDYDVE